MRLIRGDPGWIVDLCCFAHAELQRDPSSFAFKGRDGSKQNSEGWVFLGVHFCPHSGSGTLRGKDSGAE